jgi:alkyl hydroperoxide reductase subunit AhpC
MATSYSALRLIDALAKAERLGWYIPANWSALTNEQRGKLTNNQED